MEFRPEETAKGPARFGTTITEGGDDRVLFGAFDGRTVVAMLGLMRGDRDKTRHKMSVNGMFVRSAYRQQGVGGRLLDLALAHARSRSGVRVLGLSLAANNAGALRLYESRGFILWGTEPMAMLDGERTEDEHHMALVL